MMKLTIKKMLYVCILMFLPIFFLEMFRVQLPFTKPELRTSTTILPRLSTGTSSTKKPFNCSIDYRDPFVLEKIYPEVEKMPLERIRNLIDKYAEKCIRRTNLSSDDQAMGTTPAVRFRPVPFENHFLIHSPRIAIEEMRQGQSRIPMCPAVSPLLKGYVNVSILYEPKLMYENDKYHNWPMNYEEIASVYPNLLLGGFYPGPRDCKCRSLNAIIVPYRDREEHLRYFLYYIHQLLQRQQLCYVVIVAEQADENVFNKGQLMNAAYRYAKQTSNFDCYIFHDVDIIAEDDRILYACRSDVITHLAPYIDKFGYKYNAVITVGAAVGFTAEQYELVNGYSNEFAGWGGEDDDMMARIKSKQLKVWRSTQKYTKFKMIKHGPDAGNVKNNQRFQRLRMSRKRVKLDGVDSLDTELVETVFYKTHTRLKINTYKTTMQNELEKKALRIQQKKAAAASAKGGRPYNGPIPVGTGLPVQAAGVVIKNGSPR